MKVHNVNRSGAIVPHFSNIQMFFRDRWLRTSEEKSSWNWNIGGHLNQSEEFPLGCSTSDSSEHIWVKLCRWNVCLWIPPYVIAYHTRAMKATKNTRLPHYFGYKIRYTTLNFCFKWEWYDERSSGSFGLMRAFHAWMVVRSFSTTTILVTTNTWRSKSVYNVHHTWPSWKIGPQVLSLLINCFTWNHMWTFCIYGCNSAFATGSHTFVDNTHYI